jgi:catechol 2,3-dioxygenase-like lactoylglutathione lyase family enzyme
MLGADTLTAFLATTNGPRARQFYETILGLRLKTDDEFALASMLVASSSVFRR